MLPITASNPFKWRHYPGDIILSIVRVLAPAISGLVRAHGGDGRRARIGDHGELHLAMDSSL